MARQRNASLEVVEYGGRRYTRKPGRRYFYCNAWDRTEKRYVYYALHRDMWRDAYGPIPAGCDIHHRDDNWNHNVVDNLECLTASEHHKLHGADPAFREKMSRSITAWHARRHVR